MKKINKRIIMFLLLNFIMISCKNNKSSDLNKNTIINQTNTYVNCIDANGNRVKITKKPGKVIVNYISFLDIWYLAGGSAIARPSTRNTANLPAQTLKLAETGHVSRPNIEIILSLKPDLVILSSSIKSHYHLQQILNENKIENIMLSYQNYSDFENILELFGAITNNNEVKNKIIPGIRDKIKTIVKKYKTGNQKTFLSLFVSANSILTETNICNTADIACRLGAKNIIINDLMNRSEKLPVSMEHIIKGNPDIIFITPMGNKQKIGEIIKEEIKSNSTWQLLDAVKNDKIYYLPPELFLYKPNKKYPDAFEYLAELIYNEQEKAE